MVAVCGQVLDVLAVEVDVALVVFLGLPLGLLELVVFGSPRPASRAGAW